MSTTTDQGPESTPDFATLKSRSRKKVFVAAAAVLVTVGGGVAYGNHRADESALAALTSAAQAFRGCLFRAPLEENESPVLRFRRLQLQSMALSDSDAELKRDDVWPLACQDETVKLKDLLRAGNKEAAVAALDRVMKFVGTTASRQDDPTAAIGPAIEILNAEVPTTIPKTDKPLPPRALSVDALKAIPPVSKRGTALSGTKTEDNPGATLPVLVTEEGLDVPVLCSFAEKGPASCRDVTELAKTKGQGLKLLGTSDEGAKVMIFAGRRGSEGIYVAGEQEPLASVYGYGGFATADGRASILGWDLEARNMVLVRRAPGEKPVTTPLNPNFTIGNAFYNAGLLWDQVLVRGVTPDNERRLFTLPLSDPSGTFALADIGELHEPGFIRPGEEEQTHITGCRTTKATIVRVRGRDNDFITFRLGDKFTLPVYGPTWGTLGCHGTSATLVKAGFSANGTKIYYAACTSAGCEISEFPATAIDRDATALKPTDERFVQAVDLAGQVIVVWRGGDRGGLRMRMAKPEMIEKAPDRLLFDDLVAEGKLSDMSSILGFRLYSRERFGVLLLSTLAGLHAFRISPEGDVTPFQVSSAG